MKAEHYLNIDLTELEYRLPASKLHAIGRDGFTVDHIAAEPVPHHRQPRNVKRGLYYFFTLEVYRLVDRSLLSEPHRVLIGRLYWGHATRTGVYFRYDNSALYNKQFNEYVKEIDAALNALGGVFVGLCKLEIAHDYNINLFKPFLNTIKRGEILIGGKRRKVDYFKFNNQPRKAQQAIDTHTLCFYKDNTLYINGRQRKNEDGKRYRRIVLRLYNKSNEIAEHGNKKQYIINRFHARRDNVCRYEIGIYNSKIIRELIDEVLINDYYTTHPPTDNPKAARQSFPSQLEFISNEKYLVALTRLCSLKLFAVCVHVNRKTRSYSFLDLIDNNMIIS